MRLFLSVVMLNFEATLNTSKKQLTETNFFVQIVNR